MSEKQVWQKGNIDNVESKKVIQVKDLTKMYKLYDKPSDRLKEALGLTRKKLYKEHYALHDVNFDIYEGECVGIIGTNGSGKSTILKIITGVLTPTAGEVKVDGRISALLELGAGFNMEYSGLENVNLNGTMIGFSKEEIDARLNDILEFADIGDFIHQPVKTYSSGMFVRLAFAVAINIDPEILVVDEALSVGDVFFQAKCYHKFEEFKKQGKTILFVSHDLSSVSKYCDRVILLNKGVKLDEGSPKQMVDLYKQLLVGQNPVKQNGTDSGENTPKTEKDHGSFQANPNLLEYGNRMAEIVNFVAFFPEKSRINNGKQTVKNVHNFGFIRLVVDIHLINRASFFIIVKDICQDGSDFVFNDIFHELIDSFSFPFICTRIMAANISTHPASSRPFSIWCRMRKPARSENTDSVLISREAVEAGSPRCAKNCRV